MCAAVRRDHLDSTNQPPNLNVAAHPLHQQWNVVDNNLTGQPTAKGFSVAIYELNTGAFLKTILCGVDEFIKCSCYSMFFPFIVTIVAHTY